MQIAVRPDVTLERELASELVACAVSFPYFCRYFRFRNPETKSIDYLAPLWEGQAEAAALMQERLMLFELKARKLGLTTLEAAFDLWVGRFRDANSRVHLFSRRDDAAIGLKRRVSDGHAWLPYWMQLPVVSDVSHVFQLDAGGGDLRTWQAYPVDENTAVEESCNHAHIDEWARMRWPKDVWQAVEPSIVPGGSCHILTTGKGPANYPAKFWHDSMADETGFYAHFLPWWKRPGRDTTWLMDERKKHTEDAFKQEYPSTWQDALSGAVDLYFPSHLVQAAAVDWIGLQPAMPTSESRHVTFWDIGRKVDAAVGTTIDTKTLPLQVVGFRRLVGVPYPNLQLAIEDQHWAYPGWTWIEDNSAGLAVRENLRIPAEGWTTTPKSKALMISGLKVALEQHQVRFDIEQINTELLGYALDDDQIEQDCVISLAGAVQIARRHGAIPDYELEEDESTAPVTAGIRGKEW